MSKIWLTRPMWLFNNIVLFHICHIRKKTALFLTILKSYTPLTLFLFFVHGTGIHSSVCASLQCFNIIKYLLLSFPVSHLHAHCINVTFIKTKGIQNSHFLLTQKGSLHSQRPVTSSSVASTSEVSMATFFTGFLKPKPKWNYNKSYVTVIYLRICHSGKGTDACVLQYRRSCLLPKSVHNLWMDDQWLFMTQ